MTSMAGARLTLKSASERVFGDSGIHVVFDCAGVQDTISAAVNTVNKGGTIVVVAVYEMKPLVDLAIVGDRELSIVGTLMYQYSDYKEAVQRIASGDIITEPLETKHFSFEEFSAAYAFIDKEGPRSMKVFIDL